MYNQHVLSLTDAPIYSGLCERSVRALVYRHRIPVIRLYGTAVVSRERFDHALAADMAAAERDACAGDGESGREERKPAN
jgi:hypothetical protein